MTGPTRLSLTARQLAIMSAIGKHQTLKRTLIKATKGLAPGTQVHCAGHTFTVGASLGAGLVGVVYLAQCEGRTLVYKRARARFSFFRQTLKLEVSFAQRLSGPAQLSYLRPARIIAHGPDALLKAYYPQPTLLSQLKRNDVPPKQRDALVQALRELAHQPHRERFDLSPKNLCWADGWVLMDTGPRTQLTEFVRVLDAPSWPAYIEYFQEKIDAHQGDVSAPSTLQEATDLNLLGDAERPDVRWAFLDQWFQWFPEDPLVKPERFFVDIDKEAPEDEVLFSWIDGVFDGVTQPKLRALALAAWRPQMGAPP